MCETPRAGQRLRLGMISLMSPASTFRIECSHRMIGFPMIAVTLCKLSEVVRFSIFNLKNAPSRACQRIAASMNTRGTPITFVSGILSGKRSGGRRH